MLTGNIKIGDRIEITLSKEKDSEKAYVSQVEEIIGEDELLVHMPISDGQLVKLSTMFIYSFLFLTEAGMIRYDARVAGFSKDNKFYFMKIKLLAKGERIQQRKFFRQTCLIPIKFSIVTTDEQTAEDETALYDGIIKDLSGGGIRFISNESIEEETLIQCTMMLNDDCFVTNGKIVLKEDFPQKNYKYQYRVQFEEIPDKEREKIVLFVFREQQKRKTLIGKK